MKIRAAEIKVGDQLTHHDIKEQRIFVAAKDGDGIIKLAWQTPHTPILSLYYESEFDAAGFEKVI